jgi:release factor glutamine methyltransferase
MGEPTDVEPRDAFVSSGSSTVAALVGELTATLAEAEIERAGDEARDIVAALVDQPRFWPSLNRGVVLEEAVCRQARRAAERRTSGAPFAYCVGRAAFRHLTLDVDERVLIPRQETEQLVELVLQEARAGGTAIDVGTGSGAIAFALASEGRFDHVIATDVSLDALAIARRNLVMLGAALRAPVELRHGAHLAPVREVSASCVVANPPYISHEEAAGLPRSVRDWEPAVALFSAEGGMAATHAIVRDAAQLLVPDGLLALEVDHRRASLVAELAATDGRYDNVSVQLDLAGRERFVLARRV